jgi:flavin-dependent thymidylate synthase
MNKNKIQLLGYYGNDEVIACSAWTSTSRDLTDEKKARIPKLIEHLWMAGHETPFEKGMVHFLVDTEIASHIHLLKHRISSMNGESARYKELKEDKTYIPKDWFDIEISDDVITWAERLQNFTHEANHLYHKALEELTPILGRKRAKESARFFKTYNSQIEADISFNMRSFANFIKLRNSEHAQLEIREIAQEMWNLVSNIEGNPFKETLNVINKRINNE